MQLSFQNVIIPINKFNWMISRLSDATILNTLQLAETPLNDLSFLSKMSNKSINTLDLSSTGIDNNQIQNIKFLENLKYLHISFTLVSPNVIVQVIQTN